MSHLAHGLATLAKQEVLNPQNFPSLNTFVHFPTQQQTRRRRSCSWPGFAKWTALKPRKAADQGQEISLQPTSKKTCLAVRTLQVPFAHDLEEVDEDVDGVELPVVWSDFDDDVSLHQETQSSEVDRSEPQQMWPDTESENSDYADERCYADVDCEQCAVAGLSGQVNAVELPCTSQHAGNWHYHVPAMQMSATLPISAAETSNTTWAERTPTGHSWSLVPQLQQKLPEHQAVPMPGQHVNSFLVNDQDGATTWATVPMMQHLSPKSLSAPVMQASTMPAPATLQSLAMLSSSTVPQLTSTSPVISPHAVSPTSVFPSAVSACPVTQTSNPPLLVSPAMFSSSTMSQLPSISPVISPHAVSSAPVSPPAASPCPMTQMANPLLSVSPPAPSAPAVCPPPDATQEATASMKQERVSVGLCDLLENPAPLPTLLGRIGAGNRSCRGREHMNAINAEKSPKPPGVLVVEEVVKPAGPVVTEEAVKSADAFDTEEMDTVGLDEKQEQRITTLMIRNIPTNIVQQQLVEELDCCGFKGLYDFCYLPKNFTAKESKGFAFINFLTAQAAGQFVGSWHKQRKFCMDSAMPSLNISPAALQGLEANKQRWTGGRFKRIRNPQLRPYIVEGLGSGASAEQKRLGSEAWQ